MYVCVNVMLGHCFDGNHRPGLTTACGLRRAKVGFGTDGGFLYVRLYGGDVVALFFYLCNIVIFKKLINMILLFYNI